MIVSGFLGLVPWLTPILGFYLFLCLYSRQTYTLVFEKGQLPPGPDILNILRGVGQICIVLFFYLTLFVLIPLNPLSPEEWRTYGEWGLVFSAMLDSRFWLAFWGATLVLGCSSLLFMAFLMSSTVVWVWCTGKLPPLLYEPDKVEWAAGTWADFSPTDFSQKKSEAPSIKVKTREALSPPLKTEK